MYFEWNFEAAEYSLKRALELNPSLADAWYHWAWWLEMMGDDDEAIAAHEKLAHLPYWAWVLGQTYAWAGQPEKALEVLQGYEQESRKDIPLALIYAALGDVEKVLYWSAQAREKKLSWSLGLFSYFTATRSLHEDPRIQAEAALYPTPLVPYPKE